MPGFEVMGDEELAELKDLFTRSRILFRHGFDNLRAGVYKVRELEKAFAVRMGVSHALAVTSGTSALRVALAALGVGPGDEVITQSFTFVATVEAIIECGATPVVTEIDETLNMDPADLERKINERTRVILPVHMLGVPARMDTILNIARQRNLPVLEDTAWGCGGTYRGRFLGTLGTMGTFSFDFAKAMTTGEGGMVVTHDPGLYAKAAAYHDHGHENNPALPRWEDSRSGSGFNYRMNELQGAVGLAQLKKLDTVLAWQRANKQKIVQTLDGLSGLTWRTVPPGSEETADAVIFFVRDRETARRIRQELLAAGLGTKILPEAITWHFAGTWTHMPSLVAAHGGDVTKAFPRSSELLGRAVALPNLVKQAEDIPERIGRVLRPILS